MKGVSVIVCCYNSASRLPETLRHLAQQKTSVPWEVIIVNNLSTDDTAKAALEEWQRYKSSVDLKIVDQPIPGLSFAREKGVQESKHDYLIFCDDDNWLDESYVDNAFHLLEKWPDAAIIGGCGTPQPETTPPNWFNNYSSYYATGAQNSHNGIIGGSSAYVYGAGVVLRKAILKQLNTINFKPIATDRKNDKLSSGGDVELCYAVKLSGYSIAFSDELRFRHFIPQNRLTDKYILDLVYQFGYCNILHRPYYWLFNPDIPTYKKTWFWTLLISLNIYLVSIINSLKKGNPDVRFVRKINISHSRGRLDAIMKLNTDITKYYRSLKQKFSSIAKSIN